METWGAVVVVSGMPWTIGSGADARGVNDGIAGDVGERIGVGEEVGARGARMGFVFD